MKFSSFGSRKMNGAVKFALVPIYLLVFIAAGWISWSVFNTGQSIQTVNQNLTSKQLPALNHISNLSRQVVIYERILYELYATTSNSSYSREPTNIRINDTLIQIETHLTGLKEEFPSHPAVSRFESQFSNMKVFAEQLDEALPPEPWDWDLAREALARLSQTSKEIQPHLESFEAEINQQIEASKERADSQLQSMSVWVAVFSLSILTVAGVAGFNIHKERLKSLERQRLALFVEKNPNPVACLDYSGEIAFTNSAWADHCSDDLGGKITRTIQEEVRSMHNNAVSNLERIFTEDSLFFEIEIHLEEDISQYMVYVENITEREQARQELEFLAYHDELTGLPNLKKLEIDLEEEISKGKDNHFFLFSVGLKRLQLITTTHGHSVSDALIRAIVIRLQNVLVQLIPEFQICRIYRFMGAKFEIMVSGNKGGMGHQEVISYVNKKIQDASQKPLTTNFGQFYLGIQMGCAIFPEHGYSAGMLLKNSSAALNEAQRANAEKVYSFNHEIAYKEQNWFKLENDLRQANYDEELFLVFQPKINLQNNMLEGMEALVRWQHPQRGLIPPVEFIPVAEESGMLIEIGEWILKTAVRQIKTWVDQGFESLQVAVNVSPNQLLSANFFDRLLSYLEAIGLSPAHLEVEITEEVMVEDIEKCVEVLGQLKDAGISIAIDDFGTGYSSLSYLNRLPFSKLKIDRAFVTNIHCNDNNLEIVKTIIALAGGLNMKVIAEGIETQDELAVLVRLGCQQGQGYLFSKPLGKTDFEKQYLNKAVKSETGSLKLFQQPKPH